MPYSLLILLDMEELKMMNYVKQTLRILVDLATVAGLMLVIFPGLSVPPMLAGGIMIGLTIAIVIITVVALFEKKNRGNGPHDQTHGF